MATVEKGTLKTTGEILAAFNRGELTHVEADEALNRWDEERVAREVDELLAEGKRPDPEGHCPALLWERYWALQADRLWSEYQRETGALYLTTDQDIGDQPPCGMTCPKFINAWLSARGFGDCSVESTFTRGKLAFNTPSLPRREFGISLRQVEGEMATKETPLDAPYYYACTGCGATWMLGKELRTRSCSHRGKVVERRNTAFCGRRIQNCDAGAPECGGACHLNAGHDGQCECIADLPGRPGSCDA